MDTELARTFLTVVTTGRLIAAAEKLHVSQSTISARLQTLEDQLGVKLFVRQKAGAQLTPAGRRFQRHAATLVRTVEAARHEMGMPSGYQAALTIGGRFGLWEDLLLDWLPRFRNQNPDIAVRAQIGFEDELMYGLMEGQIDVALMYTPQSRPGLTVEPLLNERLVLVSTDQSNLSAPPASQYIFVDWGESFRAAHSVSFPDYSGAPVTASIGWLGLQLMLARGGAGYFPLRLVHKHVKNGLVHLNNQAPEFCLTAYIVHPEGEGRPGAQTAIRTIHEVAATFGSNSGNSV